MEIDFLTFLLYALVCALITYLLRALPLVIFRREITNRFVKSFIYYVPFAVLACMTIPSIFESTGNIWSAIAGFAVALILSLFGRSLLTVSLSACGVVLVVELAVRYWPFQ